MQVQEGRLKANCFSEPLVRRGAGDFCKLAFDVASVETGIGTMQAWRHDLHAFFGEMRNQARDEVEGGADDGDALAGGYVGVPVGDLLAVVVSDV